MLPELPVELWRVVFRNATAAHDAFPTIIGSQISDWDWPLYSNGVSSIPPDYLPAFTTKLAIVLVCKVWFEIGVEFLEEDIRPSSVWRLQQFIDTLPPQVDHGGDRQDISTTSGRIQSSASGRDRGRWVRRLQTPKYPEGKSDDFINLLCSLTVHLPNLSVLFVDGWIESTSEHDRFSKALKEHCPRLKYIHCNHWQSTDRGQTTTNAYFRLPNIRTLRTILGAGPPPPSFSTLPMPSFHATLHTLAISFESAADFKYPLDSLHCPNLRVFSCRGAMFQTERCAYPGLFRFFDVHGPHLVSLAIANDDTRPENVFENELLRRCGDSLVEFVILRLHQRDAVLSHADKRLARYPSVQYVGICLNDQLRFLPSGGIFERCGLGRFPGLMKVVAMDIDYGSEVGDRREVLDSSFPDRGAIRFEDCKGNEVALVHPKAIPVVGSNP